MGANHNCEFRQVLVPMPGIHFYCIHCLQVQSLNVNPEVTEAQVEIDEAEGTKSHQVGIDVEVGVSAESS